MQDKSLMLAFEVLTWLFFGLACGLMSDWFRERPRRTMETLMVAVGGAVAGGLIALVLEQGGIALDLDGYNVLGALLSAALALVAIYVDHGMRRHHFPIES